MLNIKLKDLHEKSKLKYKKAYIKFKKKYCIDNKQYDTSMLITKIKDNENYKLIINKFKNK